MPDINVTAHGINPKTGEYLSPAERKALFKKGRMGSKIDPSVFRSGVASSTKKTSTQLPKTETGGGTGGGGGSVIVPISGLSSGVLSTEVKDLEPPVEKVRVNVDDAPPQEAEESKESFKDALKKLLESLRRITKLKNKQGKTSKKTDKLRGKQKYKKKKERKTPGRDIFGVGRKIKGKVTKTMGDIFGIFGDIIAFGILSWIGDPKNKKMVKGIVKFLGHALKFVNFFVGNFVDNTLTGLSQLLGPDRSLGERFSGALKLIGSFFILRWLKNPFKMIKDLKKIFKIFGKFGKFVNKILRKPIRMIQNFVQKALNKTLGRVFKSAIFKPFRRFIIQVGGKSLFKLLGAVGRGFVKIISRVPFIGALLQFFMDVFLFKQPPARSAFKAIGGALLGAVGMLGGPIGAIIGGWVGSEAGGWLYDAWFGSGHNPDDPKKDKEESSSGDQTTSDTPVNSPGNNSPAAGNWSPVLNLIAAHESVGGSYDSVYPSTTKQKYSGGPPLTEMTIAEADAWQVQTYRARGSSAAGRYQFMKIKKQAADAGIGANELFSAENQDKMAIHLLSGKRRITMDMIKNDPNEAMIRLGMEWAAFPMPVSMQGHKQRVSVGQSYYAGDGRNAAGATVSEVKGVFANMGGGSGVFKPAAKMKRKPVKNMYMPSMSAEFTINEKIKHSVVSEQPIIINNVQENSIGLSISTLTLNNKKKSVNQVLSRL